jgi:TatD DNase family protein
VGLDYSRHLIGEGPAAEPAKAIQQEVLKQQAVLAMELGLAVNVHSRSAGHHAIALLRELGVTKALFHAFDGKSKYAVVAHEQHGYMFSVAPCICRSPNLQALVQKLPLSALVLETDCPALVSSSTILYNF